MRAVPFYRVVRRRQRSPINLQISGDITQCKEEMDADIVFLFSRVMTSSVYATLFEYFLEESFQGRKYGLILNRTYLT